MAADPAIPKIDTSRFSTFATLKDRVRKGDALLFDTRDAGAPVKMAIISRDMLAVVNDIDKARAELRQRRGKRPKPLTEEEKEEMIQCIHWEFEGQIKSIDEAWSQCIRRHFQEDDAEIRYSRCKVEPLKDVMEQYGHAKIDNMQEVAKKLGLVPFGSTQLSEEIVKLIDNAASVERRTYVFDEVMATDEQRITFVKFGKSFSPQLMKVGGFGTFLRRLIVAGFEKALEFYRWIAGLLATGPLAWLVTSMAGYEAEFWGVLETI